MEDGLGEDSRTWEDFHRWKDGRKSRSGSGRLKGESWSDLGGGATGLPWWGPPHLRRAPCWTVCNIKYIGRPYNDVYFVLNSQPIGEGWVGEYIVAKSRKEYLQSVAKILWVAILLSPSPVYRKHKGWRMYRYWTQSNVKDLSWDDDWRWCHFEGNQMSIWLSMQIYPIPKLFFSKTFAKSAIKLWKEIPPKMTQKMVQKLMKIDDDEGGAGGWRQIRGFAVVGCRWQWQRKPTGKNLDKYK